MDSSVLKVFGTGQVTLPKRWRDRFNLCFLKATLDGNKIVMTPIVDEEGVMFDAERDNDGKGVDIKTFAKALRASLS